jgi:MFS family permease
MTVETHSISLTASSSLRRAAPPALFTLLGLVYGTWAARIPAIRDALEMTPAQLGLVLLCAGIGAVISFPLAAWLVGRNGARNGTRTAGWLLLAILPLLSLAPSVPLLMVGMIVYGVAGSCFDVGINALGAAEEKAAGRSIMSLLHAWFCVGTSAGAILGGLAAGLGIGPVPHFGATAAVLVLLLWVACGALPRDEPQPVARSKKRFALPHGSLIALGVIGFCGAIAEGSLIDWSAVYMRDRMKATEGIAPLGFAAFSATMLLARLIGDRLKDRFGARSVVGVGALGAAIGIFISVFAPSIPIAIAGFAVAGVGLATVFPFVYGAAARHGATALAGVASMGYSGSLLGPPAIGFIANNMGMQAALGFIGLLSVGVALAASRARSLS